MARLSYSTFPTGYTFPIGEEAAPAAAPAAPAAGPEVSGTGASPGNGSPIFSTGVNPPVPKTMSEIKESLLQPALTSHYQCWFNPPGKTISSGKTDDGKFRSWLRNYKKFVYETNQELISLSCCEASLPGSSFMTNEIADDHTGVTERHAYRRQYDDRSDFTFYVDHGRPGGNYKVLLFFEYWMQYIAGEDFSEGLEDSNYFYRVNYPKDYQSPALYLNKFERNHEGDYLEYRFLQAYPTSISSMPVSYDSSQLLKCTVSFTYTRYVITRRQIPKIRSEVNRLNQGVEYINRNLPVIYRPNDGTNIPGLDQNLYPNLA